MHVWVFINLYCSEKIKGRQKLKLREKHTTYTQIMFHKHNLSSWKSNKKIEIKTRFNLPFGASLRCYLHKLDG